ncbi:MAG: zf-HC2 domain-containing protein, partial [Candidatus Tumulicola sp.]
MRCSWCEPLLDAYVEGTLDAAQTGAMATHLRTCTACDAAHRRLRVVDALLMTARAPELRADFTGHVMTAVRLLPAPAPLRKPLLPLAAFYLVAAWIVTGA